MGLGSFRVFSSVAFVLSRVRELGAELSNRVNCIGGILHFEESNDLALIMTTF